MTEKEKEYKRQLERLNVLENTFKIDYYRRLAEEELLVGRSKARRHFGNFVKHVKPNYRWAWHNKLLAKKLNDFAHGKIKRLMIFLPPRHGKSELGSRLLPSYILGINPNASVIAASYSSALAKRMSRDVQRIMDDNLYQEVFPKVRLVPYKKKKGDDLNTDNFTRTAELFDVVGYSGGYRAAGVDTGITGMGASHAIIDDPLKDMKSASSATIKQSIEEWYNSTLYTRLTSTGAVLVIQTRWAEDDLAGRLLANHVSEMGAEEEEWEVLSLPAISTGFPTEHDPREEEGLPLWPEEYPLSKLLAIKGKVGGKVWASLFQQEPAPADGDVINTNWFKFYKEPPEFDFIFGSWDFAFKDSEKSDYVVGQIWGIVGVRRYLIRQYREKASFTRTLQMITQSLREFPHQREIVVEEKANGAAIIDTLKHKIGIIVPYSPSESKQARAAAIAPQIEAGNVYLPDIDYHPDAYWVDGYINEWKHFPNGSHDDQVDTTTQALIRVSNSFGGWLSATTSGENELVEENMISEELADIFGFNLNNRGGGMGLGF
jgi:predicted phage terminase large subunit-like protein